MRDIQTQANAAHGFGLWLTSTLRRQTDDSREFSEQLLHVLDIYGREANRRIDGDPATPEWCNLVPVTSTLTTLLQDELYAVNPALKAYRPEDEPQSVDQMVARLLSDALTLFAQCGRQEALAPIDALVQRVVTQV